jgi:hypothetical protein
MMLIDFVVLLAKQERGILEPLCAEMQLIMVNKRMMFQDIMMIIYVCIMTTESGATNLR